MSNSKYNLNEILSLPRSAKEIIFSLMEQSRSGKIPHKEVVKMSLFVACIEAVNADMGLDEVVKMMAIYWNSAQDIKKASH